jgi:hypothetical protein
MEQTRLGDTGLKIIRLALGCISYREAMSRTPSNYKLPSSVTISVPDPPAC